MGWTTLALGRALVFLDWQAEAAVLVHHGQELVPPAHCGGVALEVHGPQLMRAFRPVAPPRDVGGPFALPRSGALQAFFRPESLHSLWGWVLETAPLLNQSQRLDDSPDHADGQLGHAMGKVLHRDPKASRAWFSIYRRSSKMGGSGREAPAAPARASVSRAGYGWCN